MVTEIKIPFREDMQKAILEGKKTMTCRTKTYGEKGDTFVVGGSRFVLTSVTKVNLGIVATCYYSLEGVGSPEEFIHLWDEIHPHRGYSSIQSVWVHRFMREVIE